MVPTAAVTCTVLHTGSTHTQGHKVRGALTHSRHNLACKRPIYKPESIKASTILRVWCASRHTRFKQQAKHTSQTQSYTVALIWGAEACLCVYRQTPVTHKQQLRYTHVTEEKIAYCFSSTFSRFACFCTVALWRVFEGLAWPLG